jgi:hypothetical protein
MSSLIMSGYRRTSVDNGSQSIEVASNAVLGAVSTSWMHLIALPLSLDSQCLVAYGARPTLILRCLHRWHPARDFLCDRLGGICFV